MKSPVEKSGRTTRELLDRYELYARSVGFSRPHVNHMRSCVGLLNRFLHGIENMREVTAADFRRILADLRDRPVWRGLENEQARRLSGTSINTYARAIKAFFTWLNVEAIIPNNPLATVAAPRKPKTLPKVYSEKDLRAVCATAAASIRDNAVFCLFLDSGIRLSELVALKIGDVDTQNGTLKARGKGNKERFAYFSPDAAKHVDLYIRQFRQDAGKGDFLFLTKDGEPLRRSAGRYTYLPTRNPLY